MAKKTQKYPGLFQADSGVFFVRLRTNGQDRVKSTDTSDRDEAIKEYKRIRADSRLELSADDRMEEILAQLQNMPDEKRREETRLQLLAKLQNAAAHKMLITAAWQEWRNIPKKATEITIAGYDAVWKRFGLWLAAQRPAYQYLGQISAADARAYSRHLWESRVTVTTYKLHLSFLSRVWRELKPDAGLPENIWTDLVSETMDKETVSRKPLSKEQLTKIIQNAKGELREMFQMGLLTSLRLKDVVFLGETHYVADEGVLKVMPFKTRRKKKEVTIPVHPQLLPILKKPKEGGLYFPEMAKLYRGTPSDVSRIIQNHFESCGIKTLQPIAEDCRRQRSAVLYGFHSLRYSFVSLCAKGRTPQHVLSDLVGHSSPQMTLSYSKSDSAQRTKAIKQLPTITINV